jgi:iron complex outermembrane receptor protein
MTSAHRSPRARFARSLAAAVLAAAPLLTAAAQQAPAAPDSAARRRAGRDSAQALAPVTVTVLRTPFDARRAPYALSVLGAPELQRGRPGFNLAEALVAVPGVQVDNRYNYALGERISVRGFGARAQFGVRGVRVLVDGIPATMPDGQTTLNHVDVSDLGRAEVVRGPASAVYGNASGGVLMLESERPPDAPLSERARALAGGDGLRRLQSTTGGRVALGGAAGGAADYSLNVSRLTYSGHRAWDDARNSYAALNAGVGGARTSLRVVGHVADYAAHNPGALSAALLRADPRRAYADNAVRWRAGEEGRHRQLGATLRQEVGAGELSLGAYALRRDLDNPIPQRVVALDRRASGLRASYALPFRAAGISARAVVGAEGDLQRDARRNFVNDTGAHGALTLDQLERVGASAGYAQLALDLSRRLALLGALRYDRTRFRVSDHFVTATDPDDSGERTMGAASPSVGASWRVGRGGSLYANYATAFETPTTTELANRPSGAGGFNPELKPQRTRSVEVGATARVAGLGSVQLALYRAGVRDALVPFEVPGAPGRQFFRNAGSAVHRGFEAGATLAPLRALTVRAAYTWTDARFDHYVVGTTSYDGHRVPGIAPHRADVVLSWLAPRGLVAELETRYLSAVPVADADPAGSAAGAYALAGLRLTATRAAIGGVTVAPYAGVTNLLDRAYVGSVTVNAFGGRYYEPGPRRTGYVGVEVGAPGRAR